MMKVSKRYQNTLDGYLKWSLGDPYFMRPESSYWLHDLAGPSASECMLQWESHGFEPVITSQPELLADYIQGKRSRDFLITEWKAGISDKLFVAEEFYIPHPYFNPIKDDKEFESIFGRPLDKARLLVLSYFANEFVRDISGKVYRFNNGRYYDEYDNEVDRSVITFSRNQSNPLDTTPMIL